MASSWTRRLMGVAIVFATFLTCIPALAQTGGLTGKCTGEGGVALAGYTVQIERTEIKWTSHVKTNKKGEFTYIGLAPGHVQGHTFRYRWQAHVLPNPEAWGSATPPSSTLTWRRSPQKAKKTQANNPEYQKAGSRAKAKLKFESDIRSGTRPLWTEAVYRGGRRVREGTASCQRPRMLLIVIAQLADTWAKAGDAETNHDARAADQAKALDYYNKGIQLTPNDATLHNNLGNLYAEMGKSAEAAAEFKKAAALDPTHASGYYYNLGAIMVNKGQMDEAAAALKKATDIDPSNAQAWYWYGMALMGKAQVKPDGTMVPAPGTIEAFQTYLKLAPNGTFAAQAQASIDSLQSKGSLEYKKTKK